MRMITWTITLLGLLLLPLGAAAQEVLKIGAAVSLTGNLAREGALLRDGYQFWRDAVNEVGGIEVDGKKYKVEVIFYDDESKAQTSAQLTEKLITQDGVSFIFGPYSSGIALATAAISEKYKILTLAPMATADSLYQRGYKYIFTNSPLSSMTALPLVDVLTTLEPRPSTVAIVGMDDLFPNLFIGAIEKRAKEKGFEISYVGKYPKGSADLSAVVTALKSANPDVVMTSGFVQDSVLLVRQMDELRFQPKFIGSAFALNVPELRSVLGPLAENLVGVFYWDDSLKFTGPLIESSAAYASAFQSKFNKEPNHTSASASAAGVILQEAIRIAGSLDSTKVREALLGNEFNTFFGPARFDERGTNVLGPSLIMQVQKGSPVIVYPKDIAETSDIVYPRPQAK